MSVDLNLLHAQIESHLMKIEELLPPTYKLTLIARCINEELDDADMMFSVDNIWDVESAIQKRIDALTKNTKESWR